MLPRPYRLTRSADFARVRAEGRCWSNRALVLCRSANQLPHSRFGFAVSRRLGKATARNRIKRLLREAVRAEWQHIVPGWDVVLIARAGSAALDYWAMREAVCHLLRLAQLLAAERPGEHEQG